MEGVTHLQVAYLLAVDFVFGYHDMLAHQMDVLLPFFPFHVCPFA